MAYLVEKIAETVSKTLGITAVYGDKVTVGGVEILPVALVYFGFGGGNDESDASGGGGGGASIPIGAYISGRSGPTFRPNPITFLAVAIPLTLVWGRAFSRVIKALKK